jgi:hypothetical protein
MDVALSLKLRRPDKTQELTKAHELQKRTKLKHIRQMLMKNFFKHYSSDREMTESQKDEVEDKVRVDI